MRIPLRLSKSSFLKSIFVFALFLLLFLTAISYRNTTRLTQSFTLLDHSYRVQIELEQLMSYLKDAETAQRGFLITGDSAYLQPYFFSQNKIPETFYELKELVKINRIQTENVDSLVHLINYRISLLESNIENNFEGNVQGLYDYMNKGRLVMDNIRVLINKMVEIEHVTFQDQQEKYHHEIKLTPLVSLFLFIFSLLVFIVAYVKINQDYITLRQTNEKLRINSEAMKHAEIIGEFSFGLTDMSTMDVTVSDNFYNLIGVPVNSFYPDFENFSKYIHPDDIIKIGQLVAKFKNEDYVLPLDYRVIRPNGEVRYFMSVGKFIYDKDGRRKRITVNKDITQSQLSQRILEEKNIEFEKIIKELESFNRIASHDLQEPLRKIQTFISRINEKELEKLSDAGREYFQRIQSSANKMRKLIDDLLLFSRTNKAEKTFEKTDLNELMEEVIDELAQEILDKKAGIHYSHLPTLKVITYQIKQLFINLLGNSLKYSRKDVAPQIQVTGTIVNAKDYPELNKDVFKKYYLITVTDNGLGFEQQYAKEIFVLFQRLHHEKEFPGTGIGLSICKKIVENHNGIITAEGWPDKGSRFSMFFPL